MRVLWLSETPIQKNSYCGRGWIESLENLIKDSVGLGIAYFSDKDLLPFEEDGAKYYPIRSSFSRKSGIQRIISRWNRTIDFDDDLKSIKDVIDEFKPDLIHLFGTESQLINIVISSKCPVIVHLQGLLCQYKEAFLPPAISKRDLLTKIFSLYTFIKGASLYSQYSFFQRSTDRELSLFRHCKYFMGRTDWDFQLSQLLSPGSHYFSINEVLREQFYQGRKWQLPNRESLIIVSTISETLYKGLDFILKTAAVLKKYTDFDFQWQICGLTSESKMIDFFEKKYKLFFLENNIVFLGVKPANELIDILLNASVYVHPSYIDNSPNSLCEAQVLGLPVIACYVGGISSLIQNGKNGILVPANDPYYLSSQIMYLHNNPEECKKIADNAYITANQRHNREQIKKKILCTYNDVYKTIL
jgi:Glycosyltransferase